MTNYVRKGKAVAALGDFNDVQADATVKAGSFLMGSTEGGIVAHAGGTKAAARALTKQFNEIATCATANDSVLLPDAIAGRFVVVFNSGAAAAKVYGKGTDTIDGVATATGVPLTATKRAIFICLTNGAWISAQLGVVSA